MSEPVSPIARAILGGDANGVPDHKVECCICGKPTVLEGYLVNSLKLWNKDQPAENQIRPSDIRVAHEGTCNAKLYEYMRKRAEERTRETLGLWRLFLAGSYNPESLAILRERGYADRVAKKFAETGTAKAVGIR